MYSRLRNATAKLHKGCIRGRVAGFAPFSKTSGQCEMDLQINHHSFPWGAKLYPSGEFVLWRKRNADKQQFKACFVSAATWLFAGRNLGEVFDVYGAQTVYRWWRAAEAMEVPRMRPYPASPVNACPVDGWKNLCCDLGLSALAKSEKRRRGMGGLTPKGKITVREAAIGLEDRYGKKCLSFWTCTLPRLTLEDAQSVCENWSKILDNLKNKLKYHLEKAGLPPHIVGVTELQSKRYEREGFPAWHLHVVFVGRKPYGTWALPTTTLDTLWRDAVTEHCASDYGWSSASNVQRVKATVGGYLSKYMTKGTALIKTVAEAWPRCIPKSWYVCTNALKAWIRANTRCSEEVARWLYARILDDIKNVIAPYPFKLETRPGCYVAVCWLGRIPDPPSYVIRLT